ncbi:hypothetical protein LOZ36_001977 [Ophidiomyces ophidiicola]|nr:hypothetical protein LOZ36_001977 [Ophidiomyces ophidiicola]
MPVTRRSARLRGETPTYEFPHAERKPSRATPKLPSVTERDSVSSPKQTPNAHPTTPLKSAITSPIRALSSLKKIMKTPTTAGPLRPCHEDMHPSKAQQSTAKQLDTGRVLGFRPIEMDPNSPTRPLLTLSNTPSKGGLSHPDQLEELSYDFKLSCDNSELSTEAQKIMRSIREDAARIKAEMIMKEGERKQADTDKTTGGERKIAKAKGRIGRFSNAHMAQFKKMDSIANHPSSFRARSDRIQPGVTKSLKRTISKAHLTEHESSTIPLATSTAKKPKTKADDDTSTRRPLSKDGQAGNRPHPTVKSSGPETTPYKPALAHSASVKNIPATKIPSLSRSPSKPDFASRTPHTDLKLKPRQLTPSLGGLKSILRQHQPLFSNDPVKIAAGTHQSFSTSDFGRKLLGQDNNNPIPPPSVKKHVDFSDTATFCEGSPEAPKYPETPHLDTGDENDEIIYPALPPLSTPQDAKRPPFVFNSTSQRPLETSSPRRQLLFSPAGGIPHGIMNKKRHREGAEDDLPESKRSTEISSEQRSAKRVKTHPSTLPKVQTPSPVKQRPAAGGTPRSIGRTMSSSVHRKSGLSLSRLSFLARPKQRG